MFSFGYTSDVFKLNEVVIFNAVTEYRNVACHLSMKEARKVRHKHRWTRHISKDGSNTV